MTALDEGDASEVSPAVRATPISTRAPVPQPRRLSRRPIALFAGGSALGLPATLGFALRPDSDHAAVPETVAVDRQQQGDLLATAGLLSALFGASVNLTTSGDNDGIALAIRDSAGRSAGSAGDKLVERQLDVQPTIVVRPGARVRLLVSRDLVLDPWLPAAG